MKFKTYNIIRQLIALSPLIFFCLVLSGCTLVSSDKVVIKRQFLYDIEKTFQDEAQSGIDKSDIYNHLWEYNYYDLIYLVQKGDLKAIDIGILLVGQEGYPTCLFERIEELAMPLVNSNPDYFWTSIKKKNPDLQLTALFRIEDTEGNIMPHEKVVDYIEKTPEVKRRFVELQEENKQNETTN